MSPVSSKFLTIIAVCLLVFGFTASNAMAAGSGGGSGGDTVAERPGQSDFRAGKDLIKQERYGEAVASLQKAVDAQPKNPDYLTELAFALRKSGDRDSSFGLYEKALSIDSDHVGALNYLGMLYIETDRPHKAVEMLERIDDACFFTCDEYTTLKAAIESGDTSAY